MVPPYYLLTNPSYFFSLYSNGHKALFIGSQHHLSLFLHQCTSIYLFVTYFPTSEGLLNIEKNLFLTTPFSIPIGYYLFTFTYCWVVAQPANDLAPLWFSCNPTNIYTSFQLPWLFPAVHKNFFPFYFIFYNTSFN